MIRVASAKKGIVTQEMRKAAASENMAAKALCRALADGSVVIARNTRRRISPLAIGAGTRIKINANIGTSSAKADIKEELQKMRVAVKYGADAIMDLSTSGDLTEIRAAILRECRWPWEQFPCTKWPLSHKARRSRC